MSQLAELKTLTEMSDSMKELFGTSSRQPSGGRRANGSQPVGEEHKCELKGKQAPSWRGRSTVRRCDRPDLPSAIISRLRDTEAAMCCTLFSKKKHRIRDRNANACRAYNELVTKQPTVERGSPHMWFYTAMLKSKRRP